MSSLINFTPEDNSELKSPKNIVQEQCDELDRITNSLVIGKIQDYDGPIRSYSSNLASAITRTMNPTFDVQDELGDVSGTKFRFEFFLSSKHTPKFKYRVLFLEYGISFYPLLIVMDETIAKELNCQYCVECNDETDFNNLLAGILNSDKMKNVVNSLFSINIQEEKRF